MYVYIYIYMNDAHLHDLQTAQGTSSVEHSSRCILFFSSLFESSMSISQHSGLADVQPQGSTLVRYAQVVCRKTTRGLPPEWNDAASSVRTDTTREATVTTGRYALVRGCIPAMENMRLLGGRRFGNIAEPPA